MNRDVTLLIEILEEDTVNCSCDCGYPIETLAQLREKVAIGMGYSSQLASLPASFLRNVDMQLNLQQRLIVTDLLEITGKRYFTWDVAIGQTMFCTTENLETCRNVLRASRISEAWIVYPSNIRQRLIKGISFGMGTSSNPRSLPMRYDVRSCIEIWPPPDREMKLVVFGQLAATDMVNPTDKCTVDATALLVRTLAFLKGQKGHQDASTYAGQYQSYIANLNADSLEDINSIPPSFWDLVECPHDNLVHVIERSVYEDDLP